MSASWKTILVFISSTFRDMQAERDHLVRFVFPKLREELLLRRIHLVDVDLRWGVTSDQDATGVCREVVRECRPRFLGMLGGRYGWVPEGKERSITADEIDFGVLNPPSDEPMPQPIRAFFYFRRDEDTRAIPEDEARAGGYREFALPAEIEKVGHAEATLLADRRANKLAALKQAITDAGLPVFIYPAQWDAAQKQFAGLKEFGDKVRADLLKSLEDDPELAARFTGESATPPDEFAEEAEQMEAFIEERTERYVVGSREPLLREMLAFANADGTPNLFVLTGDPGSGKSALLAKFTRELAAQTSAIPRSALRVPHFVGASTGSTDLRRTLRRLCHELAPATGNTEPLPLDIKELITHFQKLLTEAASRQRVILVFDALNQFDATDGAHWLNWLPRELPPGVRIVASVIAPADRQPDHQTLSILRTRPGTRMEKLEPLTEADTLAIIEGYLRRYAKRLSPEQLAALLAKPAGGLPLYVLTALEELRTLGTYEEITARIRELPGEARALFGWILTERLAFDPGFRDREGRPCGAALVEKFAACLGVSRHGLSPAELTALLDPGDPLGNVTALLRLLRPYLMRRGELLDFYHGQFREAAEAAHLDIPEKQHAAHQSVATCLQAFADPHRDGQCRDATPHALSELPHHQTRAEAWPDLIATLENIFFLEAKVTHGMAFDLVEEFNNAVEALPQDHAEQRRLSLLNEALRRDIHFIVRHAHDYPQALFQCLWNSCWWYDCPEAAIHYVEPQGGWKVAPPWTNADFVMKLSPLLQRWRTEREAAHFGYPWIRLLRPSLCPLGSGQQLMFQGNMGEVNCICYSPNGYLIAAGISEASGAKSEIQMWETRNGATLATFTSETRVTALAFSPDGNIVASSGVDRNISLWSVNTGMRLALFRGLDKVVSNLRFSRDGMRLLSRGGERGAWRGRRLSHGSHSAGENKVWDIVRGSAFDFSEEMMSEFFMKEEPLIVAELETDGIEFGFRAGEIDYSGHLDPIQCASMSSDGQQIASGSGTGYEPNPVGEQENEVRLWDACNGACLAIFRGHEAFVTSVVFSPDGRSIASGSADGTIRIWDLNHRGAGPTLHGHLMNVHSLAFSPDGNTLVSGSHDCSIRLWSTLRGTQQKVLFGSDPILEVVLSSDGRLIAGCSEGEIIVVWEISTGQTITFGRSGCDVIGPHAFSPCGRYITYLHCDHTTLRIFDLVTGSEKCALFGHRDYVSCVAWFPDGRRLVTGAYDGTVRIWDTDCGVQRAVLPVEKDAISCRMSHYGRHRVSTVGVTTDGRRVVSKYCDGTVRTWDLESAAYLEVAMDARDAPAIAAGTEQFSLRGLTRGPETVIEFGATGLPLAWFPSVLNCIETHPSGRKWAGGRGTQFHILSLEGGKSQSPEFK